ncbi:SpaA isopeptide-forming pilin-related protein, partial [Alkalibacterium sp. AK22]|uniref:SpaA isopeptide-forming pilin-related protein n=1 Tax=Alkalibacterium sp. AK22 TaxID=1229520 RepID=UPI00054ECC43
MKRIMHAMITIMLFIQQLAMIPFTVIAEDWSNDKGLQIDSITIIDNDTLETVDSVIDGDSIKIAVQYENTTEEKQSRHIELPEAIHVPSSDGDLLDEETGESIGTYTLSPDYIDLTVIEQTAGSFLVDATIDTGTDEEAAVAFIFAADGERFEQTLTVKPQKTTETIEFEEARHDEAEEDNKDSVDTEEDQSDFSASNEHTFEDLEEDERDKEEQAEQTDEQIDEEVTDEANASTEEDSQDEIEEGRATEEQVRFTDVRFTDREGTVFNADNPLDLNASSIGRLDFSWFLIDGHTVSAGDTYTFNLPDEFRPVSGTSGLLGDVGTWSVTQEGTVLFTFNEGVEGDDVRGSFFFEVALDEEALSDQIQQEIAFDIVPEFVVSFPVIPKNSRLIDKEGTINNEGFNSTEAFWTIDINTALDTMVNPVVSDQLPEFMAYQSDSLEITVLRMTPQGERIEEERLDTAAYSVSVEEGKLVIDLSGLNEDQLRQAYRIRYTTDIIEPETGFDGAQTFTNSAVLASDGQNHTTTSTVSSGYGLAIEKLSPRYDSTLQTFDWTINYNFNEKLIDQGSATLADTWTPENVMALKEGSFQVFEVSIDNQGQPIRSASPVSSSLYTLDIRADNSGFDLQFNDLIDRQAYQIVYTTRLTGQQGTGIVESGGRVINEILTGTEASSGSSGAFGQQGLRKRHVATDIGRKQIDWELRINRNSYTMNNLVLTDTFEGDGLSLLPNDDNYSGFELKLLTIEGEEFTGYTIDYTEAQAEEAGGFVLTFTESIDFPLTLRYSTRFERNSDGTATYANTAKIEWEEGDRTFSSDSGRVSSGSTGLTASNGVKNGRYNAVTRETTWSVFANYARLPIGEDFEIRDRLPGNQQWLMDSFEVFSYEVAANGDRINEQVLNDNQFTLEFVEDNEVFVVSLDDSLKGERLAVGVRFNTEFTDGWVRDAVIDNVATVTNNEETIRLEASVEVPFGGVFADKSGQQTGQFSERIDWEIKLNPNRSRVTEFKLTDTPDLNAQLVPESFVLYQADVSADGVLSKSETILTEGQDYNLVLAIDEETGEQSFELTFPSEITEAYILTYSSLIDPLVSQGEAITNAFRVEGNTVEFLELTDEEISVFKSNQGGGDGSSIRGSLLIQKADPAETLLPGAEFELLTERGSQVLRRGRTDENGQLRFGGLRRGTYLLREVEAPERYVIDEDLAAGRLITLNHDEDEQVTEFSAQNRRTQVDIRKVSPSGRIRSDFVFSVLSETGEVIRENILAENGRAVVEDLDPGQYFVQEVQAPEGFILNTERFPFTVAIKEDGTQPVPTIEIMNYQGQVRWQKEDQAGNALAGARFEIRNSNGDSVAEPVSNRNGRVQVSNLAPGNYTVRETRSAEGYIRDTDEKSFSITAENSGQPDIVQLSSWTNYQGTVRLIKTDASGEILPGAVFELRQGDQAISEWTTDEAGVITVENLEPGEYSFVEVQAPEGFAINTEPVTFEIKSEHSGEPVLIMLDDFINYQGSIELIKTDKDGAGLSGAVFEVRDDNDLLIQDGIVSGDNGSIRVTDLAPGSYRLREIQSPEGFITNTEQLEFEISDRNAGELETIDLGTFENFQGDVLLQKTDAEGAPLEGARFTLYKEGERLFSDLITDDLGMLEVKQLAPGSYRLVESQAPEGFIKNTVERLFTVPNEHTGVLETIEVDPVINYQGSIRLEKTDQNGEALADATFDLLKEGERLSEWTSNQEGIIEINDLAPGDYTLVETSAPDGFIRNTTPVSFQIFAESEDEPEQLDLGSFENVQGSVQFQKITSQGEALSDPVFSLYRDGEKVRTD